MKVALNFDTENDSVEDFRKLREYIENIISEKEGRNVAANSPSANLHMAVQNAIAPKPQPMDKRTGGGCRVVPYQDLSNELFSLCSKRRK